MHAAERMDDWRTVMDMQKIPPMSFVLLLFLLVLSIPDAGATTYYVRQTVGNDSNDGTSPDKAWQHVGKLSAAMHAGDTAYVGPGLYREQITVTNDGAPGKRLIFVADTTGQETGDPPGVVMITGADPVDPAVFAPTAQPGVYSATFPSVVLGVVEMDGPQYRYRRARDTKEHLVENMSELDVVAKLGSSHFYDEPAHTLYIHTSDGRPPTEHEIELIRRGNGIGMWSKHFVTVMGFTFRHMGDSAISFFKGSSDGIAIHNTSYGGRQGIRVYDAPRVLIYDNTLFRNDNSGVYFAARSTDGWAIGNVAYENIKGVRWSSESVNAIATDNKLFDNHESGIAIENADHALVRRNVIADNTKSQLLVIRSEYTSEENCFEARAGELIADFVFVDHYKTLSEYRLGKREDLHSQEGCGPLPAKIDVHKLHSESSSYAERARKILSGASETPAPGTSPRKSSGFDVVRRWFSRLFRRHTP
jgi:hypothetical protein